jgi:hypothetical protein
MFNENKGDALCIVHYGLVKERFINCQDTCASNCIQPKGARVTFGLYFAF